jgi:hypothetical protein
MSTGNPTDKLRQEAQSYSSLNKSIKSSQDILDKMSRLNCSDLELKYRNCLKSLTIDRFMHFCEAKRIKVDICVKRQKEIMLGLVERDVGLEKISEMADEIYLKES